MKIIRLTLLLNLIAFTFANAQVGGNSTYDFLNFSNSSRIAGLGGSTIAAKDNDLVSASQNPSLINPEQYNSLAFTYVNYFADINYGYAGFCTKTSSKSGLVAGIQYLNYGKFTKADPTGTVTGVYTAGEYALNIGYGYRIDSNYSIGATVKPIYSKFDNIYSFGLATDLGATYSKPSKQFTASAVIKNLGTEIKPYRKGNREHIPLDIQMGIAQRLKHMPLTFMLTAHGLQKYNLSYLDTISSPSTDSKTGVKKNTKVKDAANNVGRHLILGLEFNPMKNFFIRIGYNHERRQQLKVVQRPGIMGFSFGVGFKISKFQVSYSRASYALAGASNVITIGTNFANFAKKPTPPPTPTTP